MNSLLFRILLVIIVLPLITCCNNKQPNAIDGVYEQVGYGRIVKIEEGEFILADVTNISCISLLEGETSDFGKNLSYSNDTLTLKDGINIYYYAKIDSAPLICRANSKERKGAEAKTNDPEYNFEVLWKTFKDHYAYFELRNVDPIKMYETYRPKVTSNTTEAELFFIMSEMLDSFNDGHIDISASDEVEDAAEALTKEEEQKEVDNEKKYGDFVIADIVANYYLGKNLKSSENKTIHWGLMESNIGYLQVKLMMGHANLNLPDSLSGNEYWQAYFGKLEDISSEKHTRLEMQGINETLDNVMKDFANSDAIILDVRFNGGGKDEVAMEIIKRFNSKRHEVFNKKAKLNSGYTKPNHVFLEASKNPYTKPVYLLTSQQSASATEIMVMSSLQLKNVTRVGSNTEGVFSDVLDKELPNGWEIGLSSEVYLDIEGNNYEGKGIPPHIDLGYPLDTQEFFRQVANDLDADKTSIIKIVNQKE